MKIITRSLLCLFFIAQVTQAQNLKGTVWSAVFPGSNPPAIVELAFGVDDTMTIKNAGGSTIPIATYTESGNQVTITDVDPASSGCPNPGIYGVSIQNDSLTLTTVNDACSGREIFMTAPAWYRANIGLRALYLEKVIKVYPNPFSDQLKIDLSLDDQEYSYQIYDLSGKLLITGNLSAGNNIIYSAGLPQGMYLVEVPELIVSYRLVKE